MMKRKLNRLFILVAMATFMASCGEKTPEYTNVIPANASAVVGIRLQALIDKSGVDDADKQKLIDVMKSGMNATAFQQVEMIIKDASASGLSVKDPICFFKSEQIPAAAAIKIDDVDKFKKALETLLPEITPDATITEADGYSTFQLSGGICAFNDATLLITTGSEIAATLMKQDKEASVAQNAYYQKMSEKKGEITFFFTLDVLPDARSQVQLRQMFQAENFELKDIAFIGGLSFENGRIAIQCEPMSEKKEVMELFKKQQDMYGKLNNTFLANFPVSTLMYASFNIDGEKMYNMLMTKKENFTGLPVESLEKMKAVFGAFKGDFTFGLTDVTMNDMPAFVVYAEAKNGEALNMLYNSKADLGLGGSEDIIKQGDDQYLYKSRQINLYFGYKDGYMYMTSNEEAGKNIGLEQEKSLKDAIYAPNMKGKQQYMVIDMKAILNLPIVKMLSTMGGREMTMYMNIASEISYFEVTGEGGSQANFNLWLTDQDTNALKQIVDLAKQYAGI